MLWMSPCSVVGDKWYCFYWTDVIQQPQGPTSPPVSVSWRMHSLCPVQDRWLVCVREVDGFLCFPYLPSLFKNALGRFSPLLTHTCFPLFKFQKPEHISVQKQLDLSSLVSVRAIIYTRYCIIKYISSPCMCNLMVDCICVGSENRFLRNNVHRSIILTRPCALFVFLLCSAFTLQLGDWG